MKRMAMVSGLAVAMVAAAAALGAPLNERDVAADARWVVHADLANLKATSLGAHLLQTLQEEPAERKLAAIQAVFRFDPRRDLDAVTMYGQDQNGDDGVALLRGAFDQNHVLTLLRANDNYEAAAHGAHTVHSWVDQKASGAVRMYGAFYDARTVVVGRSGAKVAAALDVLDGGAPSLAGSGQVVAGQEPAVNGFFFVVVDLAAMAGARPEAAILKGARAASMEFTETAGQVLASLTVNAQDAQTAAQIQSAAQGMLALAALNQEQNPALAQLAQSIGVVLQDTAVVATLRQPAAQVVEWLKTMKSAR